MEQIKYDFTVDNLGPCTVPSPIELSREHGNYRATYVKDTSFVRNQVNVFADDPADANDMTNLMEKAGPREKIYFNPAHVTAGICTCVASRPVSKNGEWAACLPNDVFIRVESGASDLDAVSY